MAASSSSAAAADLRPPKYDVFISFRGEDTRKGFTSVLYKELSGKQIEAYIDEVSLEKGDTLSRALPEAIKESEISIIIFSANYGESHWCLDELAYILKRREVKDQIVLPIFYNIDPSHIRNQKGTYAAAFEKHEERFKDKREKVREWRQALTKAADLSGWDSRNISDAKILEEVVERVKRELDTIISKRRDDFKGLVGIPERLVKIKSFLDSPTVLTVGIWGMGGIGKTTLAKVVFSRFYNDFEGSYFAPNVRENVVNKGLDTIRKDVYSELLGDKTLDIFKSSEIDRRLSRKKALLVLDDVESPMQFEDLVGDRDRFCPGSKIIVTSRNKLRVDEEYKVEELDYNDACRLFYLKAFGHESCRRGFKLISDLVVEYTKGHPLALKVLGSSVFYFLESIDDWEKELEKLKRIPNDEILEVLERSYNALDPEEKGLFLDIVCYFKGEQRDFVEGILEYKPIRGLVNKSLITIEDGWICMHDLIQEMGRNIVIRSTEKLGERSRLWNAQDVYYVLKNNKGTKAIEGIYLPWNKEDEEVHLRPDVFKKMRKLRLLKFYDASHYAPVNGLNKVYIDGDLEYLPNELRYLHWEHYPAKPLPSNFKPCCLVELHMPYSSLEQLWDGVQELGSLKNINLHSSIRLTKFPDLSQAPKLESIYLGGCVGLIHIPSLNLQATPYRSAYSHPSPIYSRRTSGIIILSGCRNLTTIGKVSGNIGKLDLSYTALKELPSSIESLESLRDLNLEGCSELKRFPKLPRNIEALVLDNSGIEQIPSSSIECLCSLRILKLRNCQSLASEFIPETLFKLTRLQYLTLGSCSKLESLPMLSGLCSLTRLDLPCSNIREIPASIGLLYYLKLLDISWCQNLQSLPELPMFIKSVYAVGCSSLEMVSTSRSTLILGRWLDEDADYGSAFQFEYYRRILPYLFYERTFSFEKCTKLCGDAINNIFKEFLYKVFCTATTPPEVDSATLICEFLVVCYPTTEILRWLKFRNEFKGSSEPISHIPSWFNNQSEGSSITIPLPTNWYNSKTFLGFVASVIVVNEHGSSFPRLEYMMHLMTAGDRFRVGEVCEYFFEVRSLGVDHIVMLYNYEHSKVNFDKEYIEASFEFKPHNLKVKRCGVRMLYLKDAVEKFNVNDSGGANFKSWRIDVEDSDCASDDAFQSRGSDEDEQ